MRWEYLVNDTIDDLLCQVHEVYVKENCQRSDESTRRAKIKLTIEQQTNMENVSKERNQLRSGGVLALKIDRDCMKRVSQEASDPKMSTNTILMSEAD